MTFYTRSNIPGPQSFKPGALDRRQNSIGEIQNIMAKGIKYAEKLAVYAAKGAWFVYDSLNRISPNPSFTPKWSDKPLLKSWEKEKPPLGWPRTTDSLCPKCVPELRQQIIDGTLKVALYDGSDVWK